MSFSCLKFPSGFSLHKLWTPYCSLPSTIMIWSLPASLNSSYTTSPLLPYSISLGLLSVENVESLLPLQSLCSLFSLHLICFLPIFSWLTFRFYLRHHYFSPITYSVFFIALNNVSNYTFIYLPVCIWK